MLDITSHAMIRLLMTELTLLTTDNPLSVPGWLALTKARTIRCSVNLNDRDNYTDLQLRSSATNALGNFYRRQTTLHLELETDRRTDIGQSLSSRTVCMGLWKNISLKTKLMTLATFRH